MYCLWNGEYGEHDVQDFSEKHLQYMNECHEKWVGHVVGDFTCVKVEYDWGKRDQRWTIKCNRCGEVSCRYHAKEWRRRTNARCKCRKAEVKERREREEREKEARKEERRVKAEAKKIEKSQKEPVANKYASDEWIGKRNGHLTAIGRDGSMFVCRCDCGHELNVRPTELFTRKTKKCCGEPDCQFSSIVHRERQKHKKEGIAYEKDVEKQLIAKGYNAKATKGVGDYGVDIIIANEDGSLTAVQCKKQIVPCGINAVQEVYAGGRFYDCTRFAVVCDRGFSNQAIIMARKLGVYLCDGDFDMPLDIGEYTKSLLPVHHEYKKDQMLYEINGEYKTKADWCAIYGKSQRKVDRLMKDGCSLEVALKTADVSEYQKYFVRGVEGNLSQVCRFWEVSPQMVTYRMKHMGMTLEDAIFTPTKNTAS